MELYLIRHGIAAERSEYANDEDRPLTENGQKKTKKVAKRLDELGIEFERILTSPLVRAQQTAEILKAVGLSAKVETFDALAPDGALQAWVEWWEQWRTENGTGSIALVGHQPDLGNWAETLAWGSAGEKLVVKKAGIIGVRLPEAGTPVGNSELFALIAPKWLLG